ncbi:traf2 and NCK-interacting protein kinase [Platysternon megacephalum]|uniref:Traf2 and NCK-interacting protein kinase n=1 Tax=Platysternon megacephalum TaxID=55544 RepID=A0A4D9EL73_9SAUR|nr:traf2 and NCK-interacting protein kinase [Platysternon megacephalum]
MLHASNPVEPVRCKSFATTGSTVRLILHQFLPQLCFSWKTYQTVSFHKVSRPENLGDMSQITESLNFDHCYLLQGYTLVCVLWDEEFSQEEVFPLQESCN